MKAIAVQPGRPNSIHLREVPMPSLGEVPDGRGVLVKVLRVGVDGTDKEITAAEYGQAPAGDDYLILGHENFGQVVEVGCTVADRFRPGTIGLLAALALRLRGLEVVCFSKRPAPYLNSGLIEALGARYVSADETTLAETSGQYGPFDIILEATGFSPLAFEAAAALGKNGVLVLASVTGGDRRVEVPADRINQGFVLGNKVMVGTVNASRDDFVRGVDDLIKAEARFPGWLSRLLTTPLHGLERYDEMLRQLTENRDAIKVYVEVCAE